MDYEDYLEDMLGRPLSSDELTKYKVAVVHLEDLLCTSLIDVTEERVFDVREGYSTVFTDLFREVSVVKVDGQTVSYQKRQWNKRRGEWFNSIVLDTCGEEVAITAEWGFYELPDDLKALLDKLAAQLARRGNGNVKSKKIEDLSVTYSDIPAYEQFVIDNRATISKYSLCGIPEVQSGRVCDVVR